MNPHLLAEERVEMAATFEALSTELADLLDMKSARWPVLREGSKSDTSAERAWANTDEGRREQRVKLVLRALEKKIAAAGTMLRVYETEAKNQF